MPMWRGAKPAPRHKLAAAMPHVVVGTTPSEFIKIPPQLSFWGNDQYGDCVTAEEAFAKACFSPEFFMIESKVIAWAGEHNLLNGAMLNDVLELMVANGFKQGWKIFNDGVAHSVDWTNANVLNNAIYTNVPVKLGIAATQLENVVTPGVNGWVATGFREDTNEDHCTSLCGFGTMGWLAQQLGARVSPPNPTAPGYAMFTWNSIGIIDAQSMINITGEAWVRNPTTHFHKIEGAP